MATVCGRKTRSGNVGNKWKQKMAARNQEVRPVAAWAQPATDVCLDAVELAAREEGHLHQLLLEKEARLKNFQDEVKSRVQEMRLRQQQEKSLKAAMYQQNIIGQNYSVEKSPYTRNCCAVRPESDLTISQDVNSAEESNTSHHFLQKMRQIFDLQNHARHSLTKKQIMLNDVGETDQAYHLPQSTTEHYHQQQNVNYDITGLALSSVNNNANVNGGEAVHLQRVPPICPSIQRLEDEMWSKQQLAACRRFFMDIEREKVKENLRQREHQRKMTVLKQVKESERNRIEKMSALDTEPLEFGDMQSSFTDDNDENSQISEERELVLNEHRKMQQKSKDIERFLKALKTGIKDKVEKQNIDLPQLCCCGASLWDTDPVTCANNCAFYQNPAGYAKALQSLLSSCLASS